MLANPNQILTNAHHREGGEGVSAGPGGKKKKLITNLIKFLKTMAILHGIISKMKGSAGSLTFQNSNGMTIVRERITSIRNPRSEAQMQTRTKFTNVVAMYRGIRPLLNSGFESKPNGLSDYNMFVKVNMQKQPVYLTKQQVAGGACVASAYQITQGSLPAIVTTGSGQNGVTDILLGSLSITTATTVAQFSKAIVDNNPDYRYGDQISYFLVKQKVNAETNIPYCQFSAVKVVLDASDNSILEHSSGFASVDGKVGHAGNDGDCAYAWVHSRKSDNKVLVSSQSLISANSILTEYQGDIAFNMASSSYGQSTDIFLNPGSDSTGGSSSTGGDDNGGGNGAGGNDTL